MSKKKIFDMGRSLRGTAGIFELPPRIPKPRKVGEIFGADIIEDSTIPKGEIHFRDPITGRLVGRIIQIEEG